MYKASELREKSREELLKLISELKGKLLALRFESATGQLNETHLPKATRKDVALIFTILKEKEKEIINSSLEEFDSNDVNKKSSTKKEVKAIKKTKNTKESNNEEVT